MDHLSAALLAIPFWLRHCAFVPLTVAQGMVAAVIAGILAPLKAVHASLVITLIVATDLAMDTFFYLLGWLSQKKIPEHWQHRLGLRQEHITLIEQRWQRHSTMTLVLGKLSEVLAVPTMLVAGIVRMRYGKFLAINACTSLARTLVFFWLGLTFGQAALHISNSIHAIILAILGALAVILLFWWMRKTLQKRLGGNGMR